MRSNSLPQVWIRQNSVIAQEERCKEELTEITRRSESARGRLRLAIAIAGIVGVLALIAVVAVYIQGNNDNNQIAMDTNA